MGFCVLGFECWVLGFGFWIWVLGFGFWVLGLGFWVESSEFNRVLGLDLRRVYGLRLGKAHGVGVRVSLLPTSLPQLSPGNI